MAALTSPTLTTLLTNVRNFLNQPSASNSFWTDAELTVYLNEAVSLYFAEVSHSQEGLFTTSSDLNIVTDTETVSLPSDCFVVKALYKKVTDGYEILEYRNDLTEGYSTQGGTNASSYTPSYFFRGNSIVLRPTPNFSQTAGLKIEYMQFPDQMSVGADTLTAQVSPIFKQLVEMYAVYKAKLKESLVNGVVLHTVAKENLNELYASFKEAIERRSKNPTFVQPFNPEMS
jgi:hypothetical protein